MPGRPDTASMEAALKSLATSWDREAAGGGGASRGGLASSAGAGAGGGGPPSSRGRLASSHSQAPLRRMTQQSRGGSVASQGGY
jgi:hypothetical protein